jgi:hypothetical protein
MAFCSGDAISDNAVAITDQAVGRPQQLGNPLALWIVAGGDVGVPTPLLRDVEQTRRYGVRGWY